MESNSSNFGKTFIIIIAIVLIFIIPLLLIISGNMGALILLIVVFGVASIPVMIIVEQLNKKTNGRQYSKVEQVISKKSFFSAVETEEIENKIKFYDKVVNFCAVLIILLGITYFFIRFFYSDFLKFFENDPKTIFLSQVLPLGLLSLFHIANFLKGREKIKIEGGKTSMYSIFFLFPLFLYIGLRVYSFFISIR